MRTCSVEHVVSDGENLCATFSNKFVAASAQRDVCVDATKNIVQFFPPPIAFHIAIIVKVYPDKHYCNVADNSLTHALG